MEQWLENILSHPGILLVIAAILIVLIFLLLKKLIKIAIIIFLIFLAVGIIYYNTYDPQEIMHEMKRDTEKLKDKATKQAQKKIEKIKDKTIKDIKEKVKAPLSDK